MSMDASLFKIRVMGYIKHHAILVTSYDERIALAHNKAKDIFHGLVSDIVKSRVNGYASFFIAPDGSKEGWEQSYEGDRERDAFIQWINEQAHEDGSNAISYAEVFYGEDNRKSEVERHN